MKHPNLADIKKNFFCGVKDLLLTAEVQILAYLRGPPFGSINGAQE
jgi:hypothetical protein